MTRLVAATLAVCVVVLGAQAPATPAVFEDVATAAGITFRHTNGASPDKYLAETMGSGAVFFDAEFGLIEDTRVEATLLGRRVESFDDDIKAITYHGAGFRRNGDGY